MHENSENERNSSSGNWTAAISKGDDEKCRKGFVTSKCELNTWVKAGLFPAAVNPWEYQSVRRLVSSVIRRLSCPGSAACEDRAAGEGLRVEAVSSWWEECGNTGKHPNYTRAAVTTTVTAASRATAPLLPHTASLLWVRETETDRQTDRQGNFIFQHCWLRHEKSAAELGHET